VASHGGKDRSPMGYRAAARLERTLTANGVDHDIKVYPGASHYSSTTPADQRPLLVGERDPADRGRDPTVAAAGVLTYPATRPPPRSSRTQLRYQVDNQLPDPPVQLAGAEGGQRGQGDPVGDTWLSRRSVSSWGSSPATCSAGWAGGSGSHSRPSTISPGPGRPPSVAATATPHHAVPCLRRSLAANRQTPHAVAATFG
jgi:hypothetical protein